MILDLDTGIDDSIALAYAVLHPDVEVIGVTGTYGNVETSVGVQNALDILALLGRTDIPVYEGMEHALLKSSFVRHDVSARIHGMNGVGQVELPHSVRQPERQPAIDFLADQMMTHQDMTIVTTGPLTNLATVLLQHGELRHWRGRIVTMGGALTVRGNVSHFAEANIAQDPEAAKLVFESGLDVTMVGLDVTMRCRLTQNDVQAWRNLGTERGMLMSRMLNYYIDNTLGTDETYIHDPSATVCAIHPEFFTLLPVYLTVETDAGPDRGRVVVDSTRLRDHDPAARVCVDVQATLVESELQRVLTAQ